MAVFSLRLLARRAHNRRVLRPWLSESSMLLEIHRDVDIALLPSL